MPPPNVAEFGERAFKEIIKVKLGYKGRDLIQQDWCPCKMRTRHQGCGHTEERPQEDTVERRPSASHRERPLGKPKLPTP